MLSRDTWNHCNRRRWVTSWTLSPHKPFWLLVIQDTTVIYLRYMMIAIGTSAGLMPTEARGNYLPEAPYLRETKTYLNYRVGQKTGLFSDLITLWRLVLERRAVCQNFRNFIEKKRYKTRISVSLNILCQICSNRHNS